MTMTCFVPRFKAILLAYESYANRPTSMNEQCKSTIVLDLQISSYIEQVSSDVSRLPRFHMLVVLSHLRCLNTPHLWPTMTACFLRVEES